MLFIFIALNLRAVYWMKWITLLLEMLVILCEGHNQNTQYFLPFAFPNLLCSFGTQAYYKIADIWVDQSNSLQFSKWS